MRLLERDDELSTLKSALGQAATGRGSVVLVSGEAGIGKSSLIRSFLSSLADDTRVLIGACEDLSVAEPLGPLHDLLYDVAPYLSEELSTAQNRAPVYARILSILSDEPRGSVVAIEDLHWADDATVDFARFVARRIMDRPLLLIVSTRADQARSRQLIRRAFGDLPTETLRRIALQPLTAHAVAELCKDGAQDPDKLFKASGGNAFFVTELLRSGGEDLPASIRDSVLARVDRLGPGSHALLEAVSAIPRRAEIALLQAVVGDKIDLEMEIDACLNAGILLTDGENLFFQHEIARRAVASSVSPLRVRSQHRRILDHLEETRTAGLSRLLHHAQEANDLAAIAEIAPKAASAAAAMGSRKEASAFYALAVEAAGGTCVRDLFEKAAWSSYLAGDHARAAGYQQRAIELIDAEHEPVEMGDAMRKLSRYRWLRSDYRGAFSAIEDAIAILSEHRGPELAQALSSYSQLLMTGYRHAEVEAPARQAIQLAQEFDRPDIVAHALNNIGMSLTHRDKVRGRVLMAESLKISRSLNDPDHIARALGNWMHMEFNTCDFREALEKAEESAAYSREQELDAFHRYGVGMIARAKHQLGQWDEVIELARRAFDSDDRVPENYNFNGAIALYLHQVRTGEELDQNVVEYLGLYDRPDAEQQRVGFLAEIMAEQAWLTGDGEGEALNRIRGVVAHTNGLEKIGGVCVWLQRLSGEGPEQELDRFSEPYRLELLGEWEAAARAWADRGARYEEAMSLAFGNAEHKARASEIFREFGASPALGRMGQTTEAEGRPKRGRPPSTGPFGLTSRQIDVLRLLDEGLTNGQIGEALFISPKTVDHHVSAILARLETSSRGEAAAKARRLDLI